MVHLAVFASGAGSNAENLIRYFRDHDRVRVACLVADNPAAPVLARAAALQVPARFFPKEEIRNRPRALLAWLAEHHTDWVVLAGFLSLVPRAVIDAFPGRIVNIHPALLPAFGGKGMYGRRVHEAVLRSGAAESGITIHHVDPAYDHGAVIFQEKVPVEKGETVDSLMQKVRQLEWRHYPRVLEKLV